MANHKRKFSDADEVSIAEQYKYHSAEELAARHGTTSRTIRAIVGRRGGTMRTMAEAWKLRRKRMGLR